MLCGWPTVPESTFRHFMYRKVSGKGLSKEQTGTPENGCRVKFSVPQHCLTGFTNAI